MGGSKNDPAGHLSAEISQRVTATLTALAMPLCSTRGGDWSQYASAVLFRSVGSLNTHALVFHPSSRLDGCSDNTVPNHVLYHQLRGELDGGEVLSGIPGDSSGVARRSHKPDLAIDLLLEPGHRTQPVLGAIP